MTDAMTNCPSAEQLRGLIDQSLPEAEQLTMQTHVDECEACERVLESLVAGSESWDAAVGQLREDSPVGVEPVLSDAVKRIKADEFVEVASQAKSAARPLDFLAPSDRPGSIGRLGSYEVTEVVGQGGMGVVLKAFDPVLHRVVAVKVLAPYLAHNPQARKRFIREAQAIAAVSHDHVITIHAIDDSADQPKIVMQFIAGRSLQDKLDAFGSLELKEILRIGMQTASGLAAAHAQGLVHRDVKPSNILLENGIQRVKLTDFGLARAVDDASLTQSGVIAGTPQFMAPEQANGDTVDFRADLFSLGSVMYAMCVGHSPFRASTTMGVLKRVCHDPPRPIQELNPDIPDWLCSIIMKLLAKSPGDRFQSAREVAEVLEKWLAHVQQPMVVPKPSPVQGMPKSSVSQMKTSLQSTPISTPSDNIDAHTIFFQPVSGRMLLTFMLVGTAIAMSMARWGRVSTSPYAGEVSVGELLIIGLIGSVVVSLWGMLFVGLIRFLWANLKAGYHWMRGTSGQENNVGESSRSLSAAGGIGPINIATLFAIGTLMLGGGPLETAIVAIVAWNVLAYRARSANRAAQSSKPSPENAETYVPGGKRESPGGFMAFVHSLATSLSDLFHIESAEQGRLVIVIGWCLSGAVDLAWALIAMTAIARFTPMREIEFLVLTGASALVFGLLSLAASSSLYARQNYGWVRLAAFFGLIPLSPGALLRIPFGIGTIFWLHRAGVKDSFSPTPWSETKLGRFINRTTYGAGKFISTIGLFAVWSIVCLCAWMGIMGWYVVPHGPAAYFIIDQSAEHVVSTEGNLRFTIRANGRGSRAGVGVCDSLFRCDRLALSSENNSNFLQIRLEEPVKVDIGGEVRDLRQSDIEAFFLQISGSRHSEHAFSLLQTIQQIRPKQEGVSPTNSQTLSPLERMQAHRGGLFDASVQLLPSWVAYPEVRSMIDRSLFRVQTKSDRAVMYVCHPETWLVAMISVTSILVWVGGLWWRYRRNWASKPKLATIAMQPLAAICPDDLPGIDGRQPGETGPIRKEHFEGEG